MEAYVIVHFIIILPTINKLIILADGERMLRVLFVVKSEMMKNNSVVFFYVCICAGVCGAIKMIWFTITPPWPC